MGFCQALALLVAVPLRVGFFLFFFLLERSSEGKKKARFRQLKGLFLLSLKMLCDFIAFLSSLTQQ